MAQRQIYIVDAHIVDANGTFNYLNGYPKTYDSKGYDNNIDKTQQRAIGAMSDAFGAMCKVDTRQLQTVTVMTVDGLLIRKETIGKLSDDVEPTPEPEPPENTEGE